MNSKSSTSPQQIAAAFQKAGCGWILKFGDHKRILTGVAKDVDEFIEEYRDRFGESPDPFGLLEKNPLKGSAFFQCLAGARLSLEIRLAIWRILLGAEIGSLSLEYRRADIFDLRITLELPYDGKPEDYHGSQLGDFQMLRHLGTLTIDGKPVFEGFYALNLKE